MTEPEPIDPGPLSHSSANTLLGCEQKYFFYKVERAKPDPDYEKGKALSIGSAFHKILEESRHEKPKSLSKALKACHKDQDIFLEEEHFSLVAAMVIKYLRLHKRMGLKVLAVEIEIKTEWFRGFVDAIMEDKEGKWWIVDLKTYKSLYLPGLPGLIRDPQLTLYAGHAAIVSKMLDLDLKKFGGCRWRVATKTTAKKRKGEEDSDYVKRLVEQNIKAYDIPVPVEKLDTEARLEIHRKLYERSQALAAGKAEPVRNYSNCMAFFSPCAYWSRCFSGQTNTDLQDILDIEVES